MTTNYEKIKAMSIDEMAEFLKLSSAKLLTISRVSEYTNQNGIKMWLESEAE